MKFKFGDIVKDTVSKAEGVVYRIYDDGGGIADTAYGAYGYNGKNVPQSFRKENRYLINTNRIDIGLAIRLQCHYAIEEMERVVKLHQDGEMSTNDMNDLLLSNHLFLTQVKR